MCIKKKFFKSFIIAFMCISMIFTFNVHRANAFEIRDVGDGIKKWVVVTVIMLATGTQIVADNLSPEKVKKLGEMYVSYYSELTSKVGDDMKNFFVGGASTLANIANNAITSINGGVKISLQFINTHLAMLKSLADQWIANIKNVIGDIETLYVDATNDIPSDFVKTGLKSMQYFSNSLLISDIAKQFFPGIKWYNFSKPDQLAFVGLGYNDRTGGNWVDDQHCYNYVITDLYINSISHLSNGLYSMEYETDNLWNDGHKSHAYSSPFVFNGKLFVNQNIKVHFGEIELGLPDFANKPLSLDGVQDYSNNILKHGIDHIGYVEPHTGSIDYDNQDTTKPLTLDYPGSISYPVPLPNSLDDTNVNVWDPTLPVVGTWDDVNHKVIDKPSDYPLDVITDTPDDIPVDDIEKNPRGDEFKPDTKVKFFLDWHEIFPFCIPWDIYAIATMFKAEPKAPYYEFDLGDAIGLKSKKIVIDLSSFDKMAELLRTLEVLLFCVGLALITRSIIRG